MKKFVKVALFAISFSILVPLSQVESATADDTYERICLTQGWTSCGEWTIYDASGVEKNRVLGPISDSSTVTTQSDTSTVATQSDTSTVTTRPNSALIELCGVNMCGGGLGGYAVLTRTYSPPTAAELAARATAAATSAATAAATAAATSAATSAATAAASILGGYAVVHSDGHVCGVIVASSNDPFGNGGTMATEYMGCPAGSGIIFQTKASSSGNVAGWHGLNVFYFNGVFVLSNGTTISGGIATDPDGRVWDTGSGVTIKAGTVTTSTVTTQSDTSTVTTQSDTSTVTTQSDTSTVTTQSDTSTVTTQSDTSTVNTELLFSEARVTPKGVITANQMSVTELKAKQEVVAKAAGTKVASKKTAITCVKGKLTKKVTAVKPKCPSGYKVKK
jgi:hypothetical protein